MRRPLGAYFRVNHRDLVAMHSAITEVGVLYATATVHAGWEKVDRTGIIEFPRSEEHTSELQSLMRISYAVFCLKKKKQNQTIYSDYQNNKQETPIHKSN